MGKDLEGVHFVSREPDKEAIRQALEAGDGQRAREQASASWRAAEGRMNRRGHCGRTDANQPQVVKALRDAGATVAITSMVGDGFPDLVVGFRGETLLIEVKDGSKPKSEQALTPDEEDFRRIKWGRTQ